MKKWLVRMTVLWAVCMTASLTACGSAAREAESGGKNIAAAAEKQLGGAAVRRIVRAADEQGTKLTLHLNDSRASKDLYDQLPLTVEVQDYSTNEKIFYPPKKLNTENTPMAAPRAGMVAYYAPWGDVVLFYDGSGGEALHELGRVEEEPGQIAALSGKIHLEKEVP